MKNKNNWRELLLKTFKRIEKNPMTFDMRFISVYKAIDYQPLPCGCIGGHMLAIIDHKPLRDIRFNSMSDDYWNWKQYFERRLKPYGFKNIDLFVTHAWPSHYRERYYRSMEYSQDNETLFATEETAAILREVIADYIETDQWRKVP